MGSETAVLAAKNTDRFLLSVVVPCYNESEVIRLTHDTLCRDLGEAADFDLEVVYVNDGSEDDTESQLLAIADGDPRVKVVMFSRNFGHQPAVTAGLANVTGDVVAVIDADLQDPPRVILEMIEKWREGFDVVYGVRSERKESAFLKIAYAGFYRLFKGLSDIDIPLDSGDFALMDRRVVDTMNALPEKNRFVRGLRAWTGFRQTGLVYARAARAAGETKYPVSKLIRLAFDGIFNFSTLPLNVIFVFGCLLALGSFLSIAILFLQWLLDFRILGWGYQDIPGFTTIALVILFFSGTQLVSLGILGEYIGRIYEEVKKRPTYVARDIYQKADPASRGTADEDR